MTTPYPSSTIAAQRRTLGTLAIYHSVDPPSTPLLHRFKKGEYTPINGFDTDYPTHQVQLPQPHGGRMLVLRCARPVNKCLGCQMTWCGTTGLAFEVAKAQRIMKVYIQPTEGLVGAEAILRDALERGKMMYSQLPPVRTKKVFRNPKFHPQAEEDVRVLK